MSRLLVQIGILLALTLPAAVADEISEKGADDGVIRLSEPVQVTDTHEVFGAPLTESGPALGLKELVSNSDRYLESDVEALKARIVGRSRGEESELASPENTYLSNLNDLYRPWIMKCGHPYLIIDTEAIDFRQGEGLEQVVEGIINAVPGTRRLFE